MREAEYDVVLDARENRAGFHADLKVCDWIDVRGVMGEEAAQHSIDMQPERGGLAWYKARCIPCPCCNKGFQRTQGVCAWEEPVTVQSRWHVLTKCALDSKVMGEVAKVA